jgi:hypothetical protein
LNTYSPKASAVKTLMSRAAKKLHRGRFPLSRSI